jgi:hypothetical protein
MDCDAGTCCRWCPNCSCGNPGVPPRKRIADQLTRSRNLRQIPTQQEAAMASCDVCGKTTNPPPGEPYDATVCDGKCARAYAKKTKRRVALVALVVPSLLLG